VGKPDLVAGRMDPGSSSPSPPDPGAGEAAAARATRGLRRAAAATLSPRRRSSPFNSGSGVEAGSGLPTAALLSLQLW